MSSSQPESEVEVQAEWFSEEMGQLFKGLMENLAATLDDVEVQLADVENSGFDEGYVERAVRDIKAYGYDALLKQILEVLL